MNPDSHINLTLLTNLFILRGQMAVGRKYQVILQPASGAEAIARFKCPVPRCRDGKAMGKNNVRSS